jgi:hypothetical protein
MAVVVRRIIADVQKIALGIAKNAAVRYKSARPPVRMANNIWTATS